MSMKNNQRGWLPSAKLKSTFTFLGRDFANYKYWIWQNPYQEKWKLVLALYWVASPYQNTTTPLATLQNISLSTLSPLDLHSCCPPIMPRLLQTSCPLKGCKTQRKSIKPILLTSSVCKEIKCGHSCEVLDLPPTPRLGVQASWGYL